jgi:hypothetical protein
MPRKSPDFTLEEIPGDQYADLDAAQQAALKATAHDIAATLRGLMAAGVLVQLKGKIVPRANKQ